MPFFDGGRFIDDGVWKTGFGKNQEFGVGDFNGDGLADIVTFGVPDGTNFYGQIILSGGTIFGGPQSKTHYIGSAQEGAVAADFNADGLTDLASYIKGNARWYISLNAGDLSSDFEPQGLVYNVGNNTPYNDKPHFLLVDADLDGFLDIGFHDPDAGQLTINLSEAMRYPTIKQLPFTFNSRSRTTRIQSSDFNGDGLPDYMITEYADSNTLGDYEIAFSRGNYSDLLRSIDNGVGATTSITYTPSTDCAQTVVPFSIQSVKTITRTNNLGDVYTTSYKYNQGVWSGSDREFRGFAKVSVADADGNYTETNYSQDDIYK